MSEARIETILKAIIDDAEYTDLPTCRLEDLMLQLKAKIEHGGGGGTIDSELSTESENAVQNKAITNKIDELQFEIESLGEPFRVKQFSINNLTAALPCVTEDIANSSISSIDLTINDVEGADYQIVGMIAYEVFDSSNARINCFPVCQFTMNTQKILRVRFMCAGTTRKTATKISCWVLLKHR